MDRILGLKKIIREFKRCIGKKSKFFFNVKTLTYCLTKEVEEIWDEICEVGLKTTQRRAGVCPGIEEATQIYLKD